MLSTRLLTGLLIVASLAAAVALESGITGYYFFVSGTNSELGIWSSADTQGGSIIQFIQKDALFYANFSDSSTGAPISGGGVYCNIKFNISGAWTTPVTMTYNGTSELYEYTKNFNNIGNYSWNVLCDGSSSGYDSDLNGTDYVKIYRYEWWNNSWNYRLKIVVENGNYNVTNLPVERDINFTDVLRQLGFSGMFDDNSTRLYEYNDTGGVMHELPSQFDPDLYTYDAADNAAGTAVFIMNGTTENNAKRTFYIYFDTVDNGLKTKPNYATNLSYTFSGDEIHFNSSRLDMRIDTNRSENTSGLYKVKFNDPIDPVPFFISNDDTERTIEYLEYSNGTYNFSFDLTGSVTIVEGPVRMTIIQEGDEVIFGNLSQTTGEGKIVKTYYVYNHAGPEQYGSWINIEQNYTNTAGYSIDRNSTEAGSIAFDLIRGWTPLGSHTGTDFGEGNVTDPYSWRAASGGGTEIVGMVNLNETVPGFFATNSTVQGGRIGMGLSGTSISAGQSIIDKIAVYMGKGVTTEFVNIKNAMRSPGIITVGDYEPRTLISYTEPDHDYYNRNETVIITVNVTYDPYGLLSHVNVSLDNATGSTADDINLTMYDDGTHGDQNASDNIYTNYYNISNTENQGLWNATAMLFDADMFLLNQSLNNFTITKTFFVDTIVLNPQGDVSRDVNATVDVMNYRQDVWHPYAQVNCSVYQGVSKIFDVDPDNITDYGNGSYWVNFTAPGWFGLFALNCSAAKNGNDGSDTYEFSAEETSTDVEISVDPVNYTATNVTWFDNESFMLTVNTTNIANGTAYNASISIELPVNMTSNGTSLFCDDGEGNPDIPISKTCTIDFNITVLATTAPANFTINTTVNWTNKDTTYEENQTSMNVTINPTYILDVLENNITGFVVSGVQNNIGNMTVESFGNAPLTNVEFNATGFPDEFTFTFVPQNYTTLPAGNSSNVEVHLLVTDGYSTGFYNGTLNVTSGNGGYEELELNVTVSGTNVSLDIAPTNFTAPGITYYIGDSFNLSFNSSNTGNVTAFGTNMTLVFSDSLINTTNTTPYQCGDIQSGDNCTGTFVIIISNGTPSGNYTLNISVEWLNPGIGIWHNTSTVNITVMSNVNMSIPEDEVTGSIMHGTTGTLGNFTMNSTGNDQIENITFSIDDEMGKFQHFNFTLIPNITETLGGNLSGGAVEVININVSVPVSYPNGTYLGYINITTGNAGYKNLTLNITVPESRTWNVNPTSCDHPEAPEYGTVCNITINNTGNVNMSFSISPAADENNENNQTWPELTGFDLENQTGIIFSVFYNITGDPLLFYNSTYNITAQYGVPGSRNISFMLTPFVKPLINLTITPSVIQQLGSTEIYVEVTDQGGIAGINFTIANVTRPDNTVDTLRMRRVGTGTDPYVYQDFYPFDPINGTWGDTTLRGNYTVAVYSEDNFGLNETENGSFYAHVLMYINLSTTRASGQYYQGETGTVTYQVADASGLVLSDVNVTLGIKDPNNRTVNMENDNFITSSQGEPDAYPSFSLFSDSPTGIYNMTCVSVFNDTPVSQVVENKTIFNFAVSALKPGMFTLDLEAPGETSTTDGLEVVAIMTDGVANVNPDTIVVSLYDPLDNLILENASMTQLSTGRYIRWYNTSTSSNQGNWRWTVTMIKDSNTITKDVYTRLVGGPFDVRDITITDNTITTLGISVVIENTGDDSQDAYIEWNLTRADTGQSLDEGLDTVLVPANSEITHVVNPDNISYIGAVRITFIVTYSGTERAGAYDDFSTAEAAPPKPPGPGPGGGDEGGPAGPVGPPAVPDIEITDYPDEISTETGWAQYPSVTVNNTGTAVLHNIRLTIDGIPDSWYTVTPKMLPLLNPGDIETFVINILVPTGTEAKQYYGTLNATSDEAYDEKLTSVIVFGSREELVRYQLAKLKAAFEEFKEDVAVEEERGEKDLTRVYNIMEEIQHQIDLTDGYLDAKMYEEALDSVTTGWRLLDRARELLRDAPPLKPVTILEIPDWMITLILILVIVTLALVILTNRYKKKINMIFKFRQRAPESATAADIIGIGPNAEREEEAAAAAARREEERKKIEKVLGLLEREYKEGIISENAYNELRKRNTEKLKELGGVVH